jgi:hypothetical protein
MAREAGELKCDCCLPYYGETDIEGFEGFLKRFAELVRADERSGAGERFNALLDDYCTALETIGDMRSEDEVNGNIIECHEATIKRLEAKILAEREKFKHNEEVLMNALWKACGDDEEVVDATIESQGELK